MFGFFELTRLSVHGFMLGQFDGVVFLCVFLLFIWGRLPKIAHVVL